MTPSKAKVTEKKTAKPKAPASKTKAPPKKKVLAAHNVDSEDSGMDVDDDQPAVAEATGTKSKKTASEMYTKVGNALYSEYTRSYFSLAVPTGAHTQTS